MRRLARALIVPAALAVLLALPAATQAQSAQPRVIAGTDASSTTFPYQVRLSIRFGSSAYQCGGVIRDATHVITAGHCLVEGSSIAAPSSVTVYYGNSNRYGQTTASVYSVLVAPQYAAGDGSYDAAVLTLSAPLAGYGQPNVRPIAFASADALGSAVSAGSAAIVSGWGVTEDGTTSQNLRSTSLTLRSDTICRTLYRNAYTSARFVCAGGTGVAPSGNPDSCAGDSGGPLVLPSSLGYQLIGLVSFGPSGGCGRPGMPGAYTEVSNATLYSFLTGQTAPAPVPVAAAPVTAPGAKRDRTAPRIKLAGLRCRKRSCVVRLKATDNRGALRAARAQASQRVQVCSRKGRRRSCRRASRIRTLKLKKIKGGYRGSFKLAPGAYRFSAVVTDAAGNRSRPVSVAFRVRR